MSTEGGTRSADDANGWLLDWRFLLPHARFGRTLVIGPVPRRREPMVAALAREADLVLAGPADPASVDGAIVFGVRRSSIEAAARAVRPGGWLYQEAGGLRLPRRSRALAARLDRAGFADTRVHWHWPSFHACAEMVPFDDRASVLRSLRRRPRAGASGFAYRAAAALVRTGLFSAVAPDISLVGTRRPGS